MTTRTISSQKAKVDKSESHSIVAPIQRRQNTMGVFRVDGFASIVGSKNIHPLILSPLNSVSQQWTLQSATTAFGTTVCIKDSGGTDPALESAAEFSIQFQLPLIAGAHKTDLTLYAIRGPDYGGEAENQTECIDITTTEGAAARFRKVTFKTYTRAGTLFYFRVTSTDIVTFPSIVVWAD